MIIGPSVLIIVLGIYMRFLTIGEDRRSQVMANMLILIGTFFLLCALGGLI
jgi:hypothetical protein